MNVVAVNILKPLNLNKMHKIIIFLTIPMWIFACSGIDTVPQNEFEQAAFDDLNIELNGLFNDKLNNILMGKYNFKKIKKITSVEKNLFPTSCNYDLEEYADDDSVIDYFDNLCRQVEILKQLKEKYPFLADQNTNNFIEINKIFDKKFPNKITLEEAKQLINKRKKNLK